MTRYCAAVTLCWAPHGASLLRLGLFAMATDLSFFGMRKLRSHAGSSGVQALNCPPRHVMLIYNPISGGGKSKALVDDVVVPIFRMAGVDFTLIRTEFQGFCTKYIKTLAVGSCDCIAIAGGDGLLLEAVTGCVRPSPFAPSAHIEC